MTTPTTAPTTAPHDAPQVDLFGEPIPKRSSNQLPTKPLSSKRRDAVLPAKRSSEALAAVGTLPANIYLGTSSWSFAGWNGLVYDGDYAETKLARDGLQAYGKHPLFRTVGIDRTFYAPIAEKDYVHYAAQVPEHFRFMVKAPMAVTSSYARADDGTFTDSPYFLDASYAIDEFIAPCTAGLGAKAGPMVFQFPPQDRASTRAPDHWINRLYRFLKQLPPGFLYAVEIRDPELLTERFLKCLNATDVRLCIASHAKMPDPGEQIALMNSIMEPGAFVARWSLHSGFKYADAKAKYFPFNKIVDEDNRSRESLASACVQAIRANHAAYVVVNNKAEGSAPLSIEKLAACIGHEQHGARQF